MLAVRIDCLLVNDKVEARRNRQRIADKSLNRQWWDWYYNTLATTPRSVALPLELLGDLPCAEGIGFGFHEIGVGERE